MMLSVCPVSIFFPGTDLFYDLFRMLWPINAGWRWFNPISNLSSRSIAFAAGIKHCHIIFSAFLVRLFYVALFLCLLLVKTLLFSTILQMTLYLF